MKLQSANGKLEPNQQVETGFVSRQRFPLSASITCTHIVNTTPIAFQVLHPFASLHIRCFFSGFFYDFLSLILINLILVFLGVVLYIFLMFGFH